MYLIILLIFLEINKNSSYIHPYFPQEVIRCIAYLNFNWIKLWSKVLFLESLNKYND